MHTQPEIIEGVKCVVSTCHYHHPGNLCSAGTIEIKPRDATTVEETDCGTFTPLK
ncbi:MAG TPA: DUF1540 domain-containing protein [Tissierellaceae bacterium]|nr:DUF1540 domain-containing protein [Tissierellaceae bacterium]